MIIPIINNRQYTPFECPLNHHHTLRSSYAFYCSVCGDVWLRFINTEQPSWIFYSVNCEKHHSPLNHLQSPGSCILPFDDSLLSALPLDLLRREVLLLRSS